MSAPIGPRTAAAPVTARQLEVLQIIARSVEQRGFPPTYREIIDGLDLSPHSKQVVHEHLERLHLKGLIIRHARAARALTITEAGHAELARARAALEQTQCPIPPVTNVT